MFLKFSGQIVNEHSVHHVAVESEDKVALTVEGKGEILLSGRDARAARTYFQVDVVPNAGDWCMADIRHVTELAPRNTECRKTS